MINHLVTVHKIMDVRKVKLTKLKEDSLTLKHCIRDPNYPDLWLCRYCSQPLGTKASNLGAHLKSKHDIIMSEYFSRKHYCSFCPKSFDRSDYRKIHEEAVHLGIKKPWSQSVKSKLVYEQNKIDKPFTCSYCGKGFSQKLQMISHSRIHSGEKPYQCDICFKQFRHASYYSLHKKRHDPNYTKPEQPKATCSICAKVVVNIFT